MHLRLLVLLVFGLAATFASAQTPFTPLPGPVLQQEVAFEQANECYLFFDQPGSDSLTLRWRRVEVNMPDGWDADLCDYGLCYIGIPNQGIMQPVHDTIQAYLKLIVQPGTVAGSAWLWFRVWEDGHEDNFADVFFSLHTPGTVATQEPGADALRFYPNPAQEVLFLENNRATALTVRLLDARGQLVGQRVLSGEARETWPLQELPAGAYWLETAGQTKPLLIER